MEATHTSSVIPTVNDPDLETIVFFERGDVMYYRDAETARVFRIDFNYRRIADSLNSAGDDATDASGTSRWTEVTQVALCGTTPLRENALPPGVADDLHEIADEIEAHIEAHPLPALVH